jgi:Ca2+-binding EF-hand superfamily protein
MVKGNGDRLVVQDTKDILFHDCGDRVAQMLLLAIRSDDNSDLYQQFMLVNTHLLFPHNQYSTKIRLREMTKIMGFTETYRQRELCTTVCGRSDVKIPIIICGDFNGSPKGEVYKYVKSQNYKSIYEDCDVIPLDKAITHRSHLNKNVLVDHIMFLNPADQTVEKLPLLPDWTNLVFREIIEKMTVKYGRQSGREDVIKNLFSEFYQDNMNYVSKDDFIRALQKLGFSGEGNPTLTPEEIEMLIDSADKNGDGLIDYKEFYDRFWLASNAPQENNIGSNFFARSDWLSTGMGKSQSTPAGEASKDTNTASPQPVIESKFLEKVRPLGNISVKDLRLFPSELIDGIFPTEWASDHGMVEVTFTGEVLPL